MEWTLNQIIGKLREIKKKGFLSIPPGMYRNDDGVVGQILEREFNIEENNLSVRDLGDFELKGLRATSGKITLCHKRSSSGLTPLQIFERFGYVRESQRHPGVMNKKLFCTVNGVHESNLGLSLKAIDSSNVDMYFHQEFISRWDLAESLRKIEKIILVEAETEGKTNSADETFHYVRAYLLNELKPLQDLITNGVITIEFAIDQPLDGSKGAHDRGPHIRSQKNKIILAYKELIPILTDEEE